MIHWCGHFAAMFKWMLLVSFKWNLGTYVAYIYLLYIYTYIHIRPISCKLNLPYRILYSLYFTGWNIRKTEFYLVGLLHGIGLIYTTNKLHHIKCFVRILFTRCKTLETHSFATLTHSLLKFCDTWTWIKILRAHFLLSNPFGFC